MILHAGLIACRSDGAWRGALIEGPSGAGKSDLALRCLEAGFRLVADDRTLVWTSAGRVFGRAPETLFSLIEARGLGVLPEPALPYCEVVLVAACAPAERAPEPRTAERAGGQLPLISLAPLEPSAPAKLRRAIEHLGARPKRAYQARRSASPWPSTSGDPR
ncbi:HPr kinase/phosphorylase [Phenylobacterium sp.]|uniref:HPr kinase/phosphorylase n=1 Tax=Phenylobacterium sp. TaxID=1871053 RepID=UPI002E3081A5|nr:HPr kinase/phosphorylase [Phenylobacterium sp.]HEX2561516.1 HPr kinase/phosphorylase [Phenylobacterium sp.]